MTAPLPSLVQAQARAEALIASGYRSISNKYRCVSRIDRPDWREVMARSHLDGHPGDPDFLFERGMRWVVGLGDGAADHYRNRFSGDRRARLPQAVYDLVRKAGRGHGWGGLNEFRPVVDVKISATDG